LPDIPLYAERELLEGIAAGDQQAFAQLYRHYWNEIYHLALSFLKSPAQAEDTIQEVFVKLWHKRETLPALQDFRPYFMVMVRNEIINTLRRNHRHLLIQGMEPVIIPTEGSPQEALMNSKEATALVKEALSSLPVRQQQIFNLSREQGLTHEQIAQQMQMSKKTVANLITLTLNHIREHLSREGYLPELLFLVIISQA
jgi:RNA polymerase sigma-70 factor (ECF subfamily)